MFQDTNFDKSKNPLMAGLDVNDLVRVITTSLQGALYQAPMSPDVFFQHLVVDANIPNGPPLIQEDGLSLKGYLYALVDVSLEGVDSCTLRPWFWNDVLQVWVAGTSETIKSNRRLKTQVDSAESFYVEIVSIAAIDPDSVKINIAVAGAGN